MSIIGGKHWFAVQSPTGVHIGLWDDGRIAHEVAAEHEGSTVMELVASDSATATELYDALSGVLPILDAVRFQVGLGKSQMARIEKAHAALKKARGEQP